MPDSDSAVFWPQVAARYRSWPGVVFDLSGIGAGYALSGSGVAYDTHVYTQWHHTLSGQGALVKSALRS
jgi:hypothetical protein